MPSLVFGTLPGSSGARRKMDNVSSIFLIMLKGLYHISRYTMRDVIRFGQSVFNFDTDDDDLDGMGVLLKSLTLSLQLTSFRDELLSMQL